MPVNWNPWHGCTKYSEGCLNCYVYRADARHGRNASDVQLTKDYLLPLRKRRDGGWQVSEGEHVWTCFTSDFLLKDADAWRPDAWEAIRTRSDCDFLFITKRIERFSDCMPEDWGEGYPNVHICCTCENQERANIRLPILRTAPIYQKSIACEPLLGYIDLSPYLGKWVRQVVVGGESGPNARPCNYDWILDIRRQCIDAGVSFRFKQTGANFIKDGRLYRVPRAKQHSQARRAGINYDP